MILPLVVALLVLSGVLSTLESRTALVRIGNRHLAFKAEQLRDYFFSEWAAITGLGLDRQQEYRRAAEESMRSFAYSLLRSETEVILAFDAAGDTVFQIGPQSDDSAVAGRGTVKKPVDLAPGWFTASILGESRVGVAFVLEPWNWTIAVTESESVFFSSIRNIRNTQILILAVTSAVVTIFLSIFIGHIVRPMEHLSDTIARITRMNDLTQRVRIEFADEIGILAHKFNLMISALQDNFLRLEEAHRAEKEARRITVEHEEDTLYLLARVSEFRDEETGEHLKRIGALSSLFSELLGHSEEQIKLIHASAPLHDLGKIGIPDSILRKQGGLTEEEREKMREHTVLGYNLLKNAQNQYLAEGAKIALTHHEKWDGTGYPSGLAGEEIPLSGRIVSLVDVLDALTSSRPYKEAWSFEQAMQYIAHQRGGHFDPRLVDLFMENIEVFRAMLEKQRTPG